MGDLIFILFTMVLQMRSFGIWLVALQRLFDKDIVALKRAVLWS